MTTQPTKLETQMTKLTYSKDLYQRIAIGILGNKIHYGKPFEGELITRVRVLQAYVNVKSEHMDGKTRHTILSVEDAAPVDSAMMPHFLIIGHGRHGKDTCAEYIGELLGLSCTSSSVVAINIIGQQAIYHRAYQEKDNEYLTAALKCKNTQELFEVRHEGNNRTRLRDLISEYNWEDPARLTREILQRGSNFYVGMRSYREFVVARDLFDCVYYVDRSVHARLDTTLDISSKDATETIDNNGTIEELKCNIEETLIKYFTQLNNPYTYII